jgi:hypothetical protein
VNQAPYQCPKLHHVLTEFDETTGKTDERQVAAALGAIRPEESDARPSAAWQAEAAAFDFCEDYPDQETG